MRIFLCIMNSYPPSIIAMNSVAALKHRELPRKIVLKTPVTAVPFNVQIETMTDWARQRESRTVCVANVHMLTEAYQNPEFASVLQEADLVTPDGMPLVWMLRWLGTQEQDRVAGLDIFVALCHLASLQGISIFFLGSDDDTLGRIRTRLQQEFPDLKIAGMQSLPFRPLTESEDAAIIEQINTSGAGFVFLALGCPKQEQWIAQHKHKVQAVMLGLGWAFTVYAGIQNRAPRWMQKAGLEWLYRLALEPGRLSQRYWHSNRLFIQLAIKQLLSAKYAPRLHSPMTEG